MESNAKKDTDNNFKKEEEKVIHFFRFFYGVMLLYMLSQEEWMKLDMLKAVTDMGTFGFVLSIIDHAVLLFIACCFMLCALFMFMIFTIA